MNLILHLPPELEARIVEQAKAEGKPLEMVAIQALKDTLLTESDTGKVPSKEYRLEKFRELMAMMPDGNPDADLSRESAYGNRGE
jgi:hypothetical protein